MIIKNPQDKLIQVLLDFNADLGSRDDAAIDLSEFDGLYVEQALLKVVFNSSENDMIADSAGESLSEIWKRTGKFDTEIISRMHPCAQQYFKTK